ncbi:TadE/TadG family type IV pilus assembly protein [Cryptosporangium phraense]|uniref:Pilus assembly protein n=1 Tax=Cryptosporangium phraense TaxID=2593070 RepID=A0A545ASY3_9ACTN|nr:TadE/TadG family type IV pilus assembly protein [Cryptosporangium phraense]TQS44450.1 pilus assembly protein [Cryptosporangium phraense]
MTTLGERAIAAGRATRALGGGRAADEGSIAVEFAILVPAFVLLIAVAAVIGRQTVAQTAIEGAAHDAARAASISRTAATAQARGKAAANDVLDAQGLHCDPVTITVDTSQFARPVGQAAAVTAVVSCSVSFSDIAVPGLPGNRTLSATFTSPLDIYRSRS